MREQDDSIKNAVQCVLEKIPSIQGIYLFGTFGTPYQRKDSDLDLAILSSQRIDALTLWKLSQDVAAAIHRDVDLVDLNAASNLISSKIGQLLKNMVGFRNVAVHGYQKVNLDVVRNILAEHLTDFELFVEEMKTFSSV